MPPLPSSSPITIPYKKFYITIDLQTDNTLSRFPETTIRGGLGYALRSCVCTFREKKCVECILKHSCMYSFLFESIPPPNASRLKKYESIPRPFTINATQDKNILLIELTLFGDAIKAIPYFIYALNTLQDKGLGKNRIKSAISKVTIDDNRTIYPLKNDEMDQNIEPDTIHIKKGIKKNTTIELVFKTPFIIRMNGMPIQSFDKRAFFTTLIRRITNLNAFYGQNKKATLDVKSIIEKIKDIEVKANLKKHYASRFSTRQKQRLDYSGLIGDLTFTGNIGPLMPILKAGEITGVGKNTVFGFGKYEIRAISK